MDKTFFKSLKFWNRTRPEQVRTPKGNFGYSGGVIINEDTAMESSAFYRGVIYISTQVAKLPWEVKDKQNNVLSSDDNVVSFLLNVAPNEEMSAFHFKLLMLQCALIGGNGYAEIERTLDGRPKALWPLNPKKVRPVRDYDGVLWYEVCGGDYGGDTTYLAPKDLFIFRNLHTLDGIQGCGLVAYAMRTLGIAIGSDTFANGLYANGGLPSGTLQVAGTMSNEAYERLNKSWKEEYGGRKTGGMAILEEGAIYNPISHSPDVLQFLESRKFSVVEIARFLGLPPTKLFDTESAKFNNLENANLEVSTDTLDSWCKNLESEADIKLLAGQKGGRYTELDLYAVFRGDMETRAKYFQTMMSIGGISPNEVRAREGMAPYAEGDTFYISTNNLTPSNRIDEVIDSQIKSKATPIAAPVKADPNTDATNQAVISFLKSKTK